jgi:hypothetical protein
MLFRVGIEAECVADNFDVCKDGKEGLACFTAGENGGACEWLCIDKIREIR